jgi:hypothetical protein
VAEWSNAPVLKTGKEQSFESSNLSPSAIDFQCITTEHKNWRVAPEVLGTRPSDQIAKRFEFPTLVPLIGQVG